MRQDKIRHQDSFYEVEDLHCLVSYLLTTTQDSALYEDQTYITYLRNQTFRDRAQQKFEEVKLDFNCLKVVMVLLVKELLHKQTDNVSKVGAVALVFLNNLCWL